MALENDDEVGLFTTGFVVGCLIPAITRPVFCIPLIAPLELSPRSSNSTYIQRVGADGHVKSFDVFEAPSFSHTMLKAPYTRVSIGDPSIYVISANDEKILIGAKDKIASLVRPLISELSGRHLTRLAFAD